MFLQNPGISHPGVNNVDSTVMKKKKNKRNEPYPNFLVENLQDLFTCAPFEQLTVRFETLYGFLTPASGTELQNSIFRGVVFPWFG